LPLLLPALLLFQGCYVISSGWYQAELLLSREPVEAVRAGGTLEEEALAKLDLIAKAKAWGGGIGLAATENYETVAMGWERTIWNLTASDPLSFTPRTWWFPIVGRVPYLGFFREEDALQRADGLARRGDDIYLRTAGAYSTLGWFRDPILPGMLEWPEARLVETVLHEMVHATVWVPGSVEFNESLANFVGEIATLRYLVETHGPHSAIVLETLHNREDWQSWRDLQHALVDDLLAIYGNPTLASEEKAAAKARILGAFATQVEQASFHRPDPYLEAAHNGVWNNARLLQFTFYNSEADLFAALLDQVEGDLLTFLNRVSEITDQANRRTPPAQALADFVSESNTP
jgi:predicted aminopeptidase